MYISKLGLGCATFGREIDQEQSFKLMDHAYSKGINLFDTAAAYSQGASEAILGKWLQLRGLDNRNVMVATKILPPYTPANIQVAVQDSLRRLNVECIDLLYLHRWTGSLTADSWQALQALVNAGQVNELGASNFSADQLAAALAAQKEMGSEPLKYIQNNHNLAVSDLSPELKQICSANEIKIVTFSPLGAGFLTGKHIQKVEKGSRFDLMPAHQDIYFTDASYRRLQNLLELAARTEYTATHLALAWAIHQPEVCSVLVGARTTAHLDQAFKAAQFFSPQLFKELELL